MFHPNVQIEIFRFISGIFIKNYGIFKRHVRITGTTTSDFVYDADHQLVKQIVNGVTTVYLSNVEVILEGLTTTTSTYIDGNIQYRYFNNGVTGGGGEYHYLHRDHLGSIEAISNGAGYFKSRMSFDAWGNRRNENWTRGNPTITSPTKQGYTGHEQLDQHKLVHMQGRVYDPVLGRFLSADPYIQAPHNTQSYNRYSYVFNNPLSFTDPTGYKCELWLNTSSSGGKITNSWFQTSGSCDPGNDFYNSIDYNIFNDVSSIDVGVDVERLNNTSANSSDEMYVNEKQQLTARQQQILWGTNFLTNPKQDKNRQIGMDLLMMSKSI